jgi:hypothetical protein
MPKIINLCEKRKNLWGGHDLDRTHGRTDARTDRVITIGALINNQLRRQWWSIKMPRIRWQFVMVKSLIWPWGQSSRSKVTNNSMRHIAWRCSTYMPNMKSLSWTTKNLQPGHDLLRTQGPIWPWGQNSRSKVINNGTWHIVWRWSTYMPNMQSLSWTTKKLQPEHDLLRTHWRTDWSL